MRPLISIVCAVLLTACKATPTGPSSPLDREFTLAPGETMSIKETSLLVRFNGVSGDSRCPADAFCIQGGSATVKITAASARSTREYELHTGDMRPVMHEGFTIALTQLSPYPFSSRTIQPGEYRATLKVN
jgi:hypothetical protein